MKSKLNYKAKVDRVAVSLEVALGFARDSRARCACHNRNWPLAQNELNPQGADTLQPAPGPKF